MKKLDSLEKLYDGNVDPAELERELDGEARDELRAMLEAKTVLDALPRQSPSPGVLRAIEDAAAVATPKRSPLRLLRSIPAIRFAAAAVVLIALGITYQAVTTTSSQNGIVPTELQEGEEVAADDADGRRDSDSAGKDEFAASAPRAESRTSREREADTESLAEEAPALTTERTQMTARDEPTAPAPASADAAGGFGLAASETAHRRIVDSLGLDPSLWEDETAFQTFYWQMQALSGRSPDDEWEEAVPLEGSFEAVEGARTSPGWLEANTKR